MKRFHLKTDLIKSGVRIYATSDPDVNSHFSIQEVEVEISITLKHRVFSHGFWTGKFPAFVPGVHY